MNVVGKLLGVLFYVLMSPLFLVGAFFGVCPTCDDAEQEAISKEIDIFKGMK